MTEHLSISEQAEGSSQAEESESRRTRIAELNDVLRTTGVGGKILITSGVQELETATRAKLIEAIRTFEEFDADCDPYGEHDFGAVEVAGERYFWKVDAYDQNLEFGSPDPADPSVTTRVMTILRADEY